jgi:3-oxoacyl-[acyl-carrier protein] reductase
MADREVVLITGTRKGIGKHLAEHFVAKGALVEGCSRELPDWELENYTHHLADVTDDMAVKKMFASIQKRHGRLDVVVNNAGVASMNHIMLTPTATVDRIMGINFRGTFLVSREAAKLMRRHSYGRIVNIGTVAAPMRLAGEAIYAASKSAVLTFTQILAAEVAEFGITCNVVSPTPIDTDLIRSVPGDKMDRLIDRLPLRRMGTMDDVAHCVDFFVSPASSFITGQVLYLGGV